MRSRKVLLALGAMALALTAGNASAATSFGSKLTRQTQPSNAGKGIFCKDKDKGAMCTHVMTIARNRPDSATFAPKDGTIAKVRLIACFPGTFVLQIARRQKGTDQARVIHTGPAINYQGDNKHCNSAGGFDIEEFPVSVPVSKGDSLAVLATKVGFVYSAGDNGSLLFDPPLPDGGPLRDSFDEGTGIILLEAVYDD